jgi:hypothetical protein
MHDPSSLQPPDSFVDPRTKPGFLAEHWPLCNGEAGPPIGATDLHERRRLEFLAAYYEVNCLVAELPAARATHQGASELPGRLDAVAAAWQRLDALEVRYEPIGLYGKPVMQGAAYRDIAFDLPQPPAILSQRHVFSSHLAVPGLDEIPEQELCGPITVLRRIHGKVDL